MEPENCPSQVFDSLNVKAFAHGMLKSGLFCPDLIHNCNCETFMAESSFPKLQYNVVTRYSTPLINDNKYIT